MIVCHCNVVGEAEVRKVIGELLEEDPWHLIVPGTVFRRLDKRGQCCSCFPNIIDTIIAMTEEYHSADAPLGDWNRKDRISALLKHMTANRQDA